MRMVCVSFYSSSYSLFLDLSISQSLNLCCIWYIYTVYLNYICLYLAIMMSHSPLFCGISFALSIVLDFGLFALRTICCACPALFHIPGCWPLPSDILTAMGTGRARGRGKPECSSFSLPLAISLTVDASPPWLSYPLGRPPWLQLLMGDPGPWIAETTFSLCPFSLLVGAASIYCSSLWVFFPVSWVWWVWRAWCPLSLSRGCLAHRVPG